eukprot:2541115-Pleurochrysis_carterae.AAC.1
MASLQDTTRHAETESRSWRLKRREDCDYGRKGRKQGRDRAGGTSREVQMGARLRRVQERRERRREYIRSKVRGTATQRVHSKQGARHSDAESTYEA